MSLLQGFSFIHRFLRTRGVVGGASKKQQRTQTQLLLDLLSPSPHAIGPMIVEQGAFPEHIPHSRWLCSASMETSHCSNPPTLWGGADARSSTLSFTHWHVYKPSAAFFKAHLQTRWIFYSFGFCAAETEIKGCSSGRFSMEAGHSDSRQTGSALSHINRPVGDTTTRATNGWHKGGRCAQVVLARLSPARGARTKLFRF